MIYYENGGIKEKFNYINGSREGEAIEYYEQFNINCKQFNINWEQFNINIREGKVIEYCDGGIKEKFNYINGSREGEAIIYYDNGKIKENLNIKIIKNTVMQLDIIIIKMKMKMNILSLFMKIIIHKIRLYILIKVIKLLEFHWVI